jgi:hypothetical protein
VYEKASCSCWRIAAIKLPGSAAIGAAPFLASSRRDLAEKLLRELHC